MEARPRVTTEPITDADEVDGRTARRDRNRTAVLDVVLELFAEGNLTPSPETSARRSGISLRSVYRYVADDDDLIRAAIARHTEKAQPLFAIDDIGQGPFPHRLDVLVDTRLRVYEVIGVNRTSGAPPRTHQRDHPRPDRATAAASCETQLERQFAPELDRLEPKTRRRAVLAAADALTQIETIDLYRHHRRFSPDETREMLLDRAAGAAHPEVLTPLARTYGGPRPAHGHGHGHGSVRRRARWRRCRPATARRTSRC